MITIFNTTNQTILCNSDKSIQDLYSEAVDIWSSTKYKKYEFPFTIEDYIIKCNYSIMFLNKNYVNNQKI